MFQEYISIFTLILKPDTVGELDYFFLGFANSVFVPTCLYATRGYFLQFVLNGLVRFSSYLKLITPTVHVTVRHGTPSLTSLSKDVEVSGEVRPPRSPIRNLTSLDQA